MPGRAPRAGPWPRAGAHFGLVLIAPSRATVTDAVVLSKGFDGALVVVAASQTKGVELRTQPRGSARSTPGRVAGTVLSEVGKQAGYPIRPWLRVRRAGARPAVRQCSGAG